MVTLHPEDVIVAITDKYRSNKLIWKCIAELVGTFILVTFGVGIVSNAILTNVGITLFHAAFVWGMGLTIAVYSVASISSAHLNPAVSLAMAVMRSKEFNLLHCACYILAQTMGAFFAGLINFGMWSDFLRTYEAEHGIVRGEQSSIVSESIYGQFFPNPSVFPHTGKHVPVHSWGYGFIVEAWGTGLLMFAILAFVDKKQNTLRNKELVPLLIGLTLTCIVSIVGPFTEASLNPARDFALRLVAAMMGYGRLALPGPNNEMWAYIFGPCFGAVIGAALHDLCLAPGLRRSNKPYDTFQAKAHELQREGSVRSFESVGRISSDDTFSDDRSPVVKGAPTATAALL